MVKYFCDRCNEEIDDEFWVSVTVDNGKEKDRKLLCEKCGVSLNYFLTGLALISEVQENDI